MRRCDAGVNIVMWCARGAAVRLAPGIRHIYDAEILFGDPP
jgi:hypothetical protein